MRLITFDPDLIDLQRASAVCHSTSKEAMIYTAFAARV